jgi:hypothetical protein
MRCLVFVCVCVCVMAAAHTSAPATLDESECEACDLECRRRLVHVYTRSMCASFCQGRCKLGDGLVPAVDDEDEHEECIRQCQAGSLPEYSDVSLGMEIVIVLLVACALCACLYMLAFEAPAYRRAMTTSYDDRL